MSPSPSHKQAYFVFNACEIKRLKRRRRVRSPGAPARRPSAVGRLVSAAPHVAAGRVERGEHICSASAAHGCPPQFPRPALTRPSTHPPPGSRWTLHLPAAAAGSTTRGSEQLQGLRRRVPKTGRELAAAGLGNLSLPCHQVLAEEGEGRDAAFPVPPARLDLRGLQLPGNSRAAAGPCSARGLLGAGPGRFGTTGPGKSLREGEAGAPWAVGKARRGAGIWDARPRAGSETPDPGEVGGAAADSPA
ncbi:uncharacterized protein [Sagmatias obliquidens]|uniref:uncharacterized protein n=1 Tax=Sagmatias obliquidens TaxID=3371155 RepID=UPI000F444C5A|nr:uncharacterized protein LOC113622962 [Lagenorhynchus obliquidens]